MSCLLGGIGLLPSSDETKALARVNQLGGFCGRTEDYREFISQIRRLQFPAFHAKYLGFSVNNRNVTAQDVQLFCQGFPDAEQVDLSSTKLSAQDLSPLTKLKHLEQVYLRYTGTNDNLLKSLKSPQLFVVELDGTEVTDAGIAALCSQNPSLWRLSLSHTAITDQTCATIAALPRFGFINLADTQVTEAGIDLIKKAHPECQIMTP